MRPSVIQFAPLVFRRNVIAPPPVLETVICPGMGGPFCTAARLTLDGVTERTGVARSTRNLTAMLLVREGAPVHDMTIWPPYGPGLRFLTFALSEALSANGVWPEVIFTPSQFASLVAVILHVAGRFVAKTEIPAGSGRVKSSWRKLKLRDVGVTTTGGTLTAIENICGTVLVPVLSVA